MPATTESNLSVVLAHSGTYRRPSAQQASADAIPLLIDDVYHLFHLATPPNTVHHPPRLRSTWSRIRSFNLIQWHRDLAPVIQPGLHSRDRADTDGAWTGSAIVGPDGKLCIFYTGYNLAKDGQQKILKAQSEDRHGSMFQKNYEEIKIVCTPEERAMYEDIDFRDPYVFFNEQEGLFWMLLGTRLAAGSRWTRGCLALLRSSDMDSWKLQAKPFYMPNDMYCPECPELFTLGNGKWYLVYSRFQAPDAGTVYRIADSPYGPFRIPGDGSNGRLDGRRWYAAKSCAKQGDPTKRIFFGWIGDYSRMDKKWLWGGDMALPREVAARADGTLRIDLATPLLETEILDTGMLSFARPLETPKLHLLSLGSSYYHSLGNMVVPSPSTLHCLTFTIQTMNAHSFGLVFDADPNMCGHRLRFIRSNDGTFEAVLLTSLPPLDDFWADQYGLYIPRAIDGPEIIRHTELRLQDPIKVIRIDDLVQIFLGGRAMSYRIVPELGKSMTDEHHAQKDGQSLIAYSVFVEDGEVVLDKISTCVIES
jgi:beta-fructofuranosidase